MQLSYDYAKDRALMCLRANYESHLSVRLTQTYASNRLTRIPCNKGGRLGNAQGAASPAQLCLHRPGFTPAETSGRFTQIRARPAYSNSNVQRRGGMGTASPRDAAPTGAPRSSRPEGLRLRPRARIPEESGQVGLDKSPQVRRQAIGSAGRTTDHAGRRPGPASCRRLGSQSPLPYFITCFLKRLVDFFQAVVRLFQ